MPAKREYQPPPEREDTESRYIGFKARSGVDDDIIAWWAAFPQGQGSQVLRDLIRSQALDQEVPTATGDTGAILAELAALRELVEYMARQMAEGGFSVVSGAPTLSSEEIEIRERNVKAASW